MFTKSYTNLLIFVFISSSLRMSPDFWASMAQFQEGEARPMVTDDFAKLQVAKLRLRAVTAMDLA